MAKNMSHGSALPLDEALSQIRKKVEKRGDLPHASVTRQLELLTELAAFPLGQFLLTHQGGIDGFWTHYTATYPEEKLQRKATPLEDFLLSQAPVIVATQERYQLFRKLIQMSLQDGMRLASIPCGFMGEFLTLDFSKVYDLDLVGIDLDPAAFEGAKALAKAKKIPVPLSFFQHDAWDMPYIREFDLVASSGLSIYERDPTKLSALYRKFHTALKPGGLLITSFLSYPPNFGPKSEWKIDAISLEAALVQRILFSDLIEASWQAYRSSRETEQLLLSAGFVKVKMVYDKARIFPTVIAEKAF